MRKASKYWALAAVVALAACGTVDDAPGNWNPGGKAEGEGPSEQDQQRLRNWKAQERTTDVGREASFIAKFYDFTFEGSFLATNWMLFDDDATRRTIKTQLFYTVGQLNGENSVGRMDNVEIKDEDISVGPDPKGTELLQVKYKATLTVAWAKRNTPEPPNPYVFKLPYDLSDEQKFVTDYDDKCVDSHAHDVEIGSMWYYYRPNTSRCPFKGDYENEENQDKIVDVIKVTEIKPSDRETQGMFPEYDKIWDEEHGLHVVAVFGKVEDRGDNWDGGVQTFVSFVHKMERLLSPDKVQSLETFVGDRSERIPDDLGIDHPDITFKATLTNGKKVQVVALLIDSVTNPRWPDGKDFFKRYAELTRTADLIGYNGHSGLGQNIEMMASEGDWIKGQYAMIYLNGCVSYAYVSNALFEAHRIANADPNNPDPEGSRYVDILVNAMPSYFSKMDDSMEVLTEGLLKYGEHGKAMVYEDLLRDVPASQVVLVLGENDNQFTPDPTPPPATTICTPDRCGQKALNHNCYCDTACAQVNNQDCCQDSNGTRGAGKAYVQSACNLWQ